ncbi:type VI secretion system protein TssA [Marinibactrum halimedae]|uniref:Type VI secretion protein n=1 Tax=Marinibactrum halimedae TaxID=1444977 RepID=A0AA37T3G8_9GAMM|nr:type VI secretion system protein TssA [Marinibactrum halimedae]MCD9458358.1 type VI secretion system protein TssA [Marinibactrum halimedae]GLS26055.1 type VI secretion protein [Marinibactrum halimedae]
MPAPHVIDIEALVAPISDDNPVGGDIREDRSPEAPFYGIKDARNSARANERTNMFDSEADILTPWQAVADQADGILKSNSKDLEICAWYAEALVRFEGAEGLRDCFKVISQLIENYWEDLYPLPDEDGIETKVAPLTGLNGDGGEGTLLTPIRSILITDPSVTSAFTYWEYLQARDADKIKDEDEKKSREESIGFKLEQITKAVSETSAEFYLQLIETIQEAIDIYKAYNAELRKHCGADAPPNSAITKLCEELLRTVRFVSKEIVEAYNLLHGEADSNDDGQASDETGASSGDSAPAGNQKRAAAGVGAPIETREDALKQLAIIADYFRTYEPHTPIASGIDRIVGWGRMTVAQLMMELLPDEGSKALYSQLTGVRLDGTDTQKYVVPPTNTNTAAPAPTATTENAAESETSEESSGWGNSGGEAQNNSSGW